MQMFFDVDVRKIDIGHIIIQANSAEEAMRKVESGYFDSQDQEFWESITIQALNAEPTSDLQIPLYQIESHQPEEVLFD